MSRPNLIPAPLLRVRCFINTNGRFKVKPWATAEETLDALHDSMLLQQQNDTFWTGLEDLLEKLSCDMKRRMASRGAAVDNEVLDPERHHALLSEIREALQEKGRGRGSFRRLASALSAPACGLLLALGGLVTLGCGSTEDIRGGADTSADVAPDTAADTLDTVDPDPDPDPDADPDIAVDPGCEHAGYTLEQLVEECVDNESDRAQIMDCIDDLNDSWRNGLREYFECLPCPTVHNDLLHCLLWGYPDVCSDPAAAGEFDLDDFLDHCAVLLYVGVRFD